MRHCTLCVALAIAVVSPAFALEWDWIEIGDETSEQGPYGGGSVEWLNDGGFTISALGGDIWSNRLGCTVAYIVGGVTGDYEFEYTITEHLTDPPTTWSKCGMMAAEAWDFETPYVFVQSACSNDATALNDKGSKIITRDTRAGGAGPGSNGWTPLEWPVRYRIERTGIQYDVWLSLDEGGTWESVEVPAEGKAGFSELDLGETHELGIAINGHNAGGTTGTATVVDITLNGQDAFAVEPAGKLATEWGRLKAGD
ncbi:hypothetical protein CMK11_13820 [Candidatus Poribacteria bacterium]|nr:hypothetical protein [Candidatus Poribacteria bacterium]